MRSTGNLAGDVLNLMRDLLKWQPQIERAIGFIEGAYTFDDVVASILRQERHFYDFGDCFCIMQLDTYSHIKVYHCFAGGGSMEALLTVEKELVKIGKELGCSHLSFAGRVGFTRRLKKHGWKHKLSTMYKEIE